MSTTTTNSAQTSTPIPTFKVIILGLILSANNISVWMIFSFLPFMIEDFFPLLPKNQIGYRAGILGSAFSCGGLIGNLLWGFTSDKIGRRPVLMLGLVGTAVCALSFGFSISFWAAVGSRFMWGVLNGNVGVAKTYLGEICDDTNSAKGMAVFGIMGGVGRTIGPLIGGFLSQPEKSYPRVFHHTIFQSFPFALPCVLVAVYCIIVLIIAFFQLSETLPSHQLSPLINWQSFSNCFQRGYCSCLKKFRQSLSLPNNVQYSPLSTIDKGLESSSSSRYLETELISVEGKVEKDESWDIEETKEINGLDVNTKELKKKSRRICFANVVVVKSTDSPILSFGSLKGIQPDDEPLSPSPPSTSSSSLSNHTSHSHVVGSAEDIETVNRHHLMANLSIDENHLIQSQLLSAIRYSNGSEKFLSTNDDNYDPSVYKTGSILAKIRIIITQKNIGGLFILYSVNAFVIIATAEIFPLWVVTSPSDGGFAYKSHQIGLIVMICGAISLFSQINIYGPFVEKFGVLKVYGFGNGMCALACFLSPCISAIDKIFKSPNFTFICLITTQAMVAIGTFWQLTCIFVLVNNSCYSYQRAAVNGLAQSFQSVGRLTGPYIGSILFAWSASNNRGWPLNFYFVWYLLSFMTVSIYFFGKLLPKSLERRKREPKSWNINNFADELNVQLIENESNSRQK